jgi:glutamine amidotransferase
MCELFAMSSLMPTKVDFSLEKLASHGGFEGPHRDGWGIAYYQGRDVLLLREASAASESLLVHHVERFGPPSELVVSHIRLATVGPRSLANTQPFARELGGRMHVFAHNGDLPGIELDPLFLLRRFLPIGETDSERAFCHLLESLAPIWRDPRGEVHGIAERMARLAAFAALARALGPANFIYSDGDTLFAHADRRIHPETRATLPGLYLLTRSCKEPVPDLAASGVTLKTCKQALTLLASEPLTGEDWQPLRTGELLAIADGEIKQRAMVDDFLVSEPLR